MAVALASLAFTTVGATAADPPPPGGIRFTAAGDFNNIPSTTGAVLDRVSDLDPAAHLALGDMSYSSRPEEEWCDFVTSRVGAGSPFQLIAGNHEDDGPDGQINNYSACLPNQLPGAVGTYGRQYYVDVPAGDPLVRFVMISPGLTFPGQGQWTYAQGTSQYAWTEAAIDGARAAGVPWVVVGSHMPCFSMGIYGCGIGQDLLDLLVAKRVDVVLGGHEHNYQRTHQLGLGTGCPRVPFNTTDTDCIVDTDMDMEQGAGTVFMVVGTGGAGLRAIDLTDAEAGYFAAWSGSNANPSHGVASFDVTPTQMTVDFVAATGTFADPFTITENSTPNTPPTAAFTPTVTGASVDVNGSASTDDDGRVVLYEWDFGDGTTKTGETAQHTYGTGGTYDITLTVTDNRGATDDHTEQVTVEDPPPSDVVIRDFFGRTLAEGWGDADLGGTWDDNGPNRASVDGTGVLVTPQPGDASFVDLEGTAVQNLDMTYSLQLDKVPTGSGGRFIHTTFVRRGSGTDYRSMIRIENDGEVRVDLMRRSGGTTRLGAIVTVPGLTYAAGDTLLVRFQAETVGGSTDLRHKIWRQGSPEPAGWTLERSDSTAAIQVPGEIGFKSFLSPRTQNAPVTSRHDDLEVVETTP